MKALDYSLNIIKERKTYLPTAELINPIINSDGRIFEISCRSGSGKTFLLNLIAYALEANKLGDEYILPSLKDSVSRYNNEEFYSLEYKINLKLPDGRNLILEKNAEANDKIIQYEDQPPINYHSLHQRVTVLYDVPSNPSERLDGVIKDLGIWNENIKSKIKTHSDFLNEIKREFSNERDDEKITKYKSEIENLEQKVKSEANRLKSKESTLETLVILQNLASLQTILKKQDTLEEKNKKASKEIKNLKRPSGSSTKDLNKLKNLQRDFIKENKIYNYRISELIEIVSSKQELLNYINQNSALKTVYNSITEPIEFESFFDNLNKVVLSSKKIGNLSYFKNSISEFVRQEKTGKKYKLNESLKDFIEVIDKFNEAESISILENITNLKENTLKVEINKALKENKIINYTEISNFLKDSFNDIRTSLEEAKKIDREILKETNKRDIESSEKKYRELTARLSVDKADQVALNKEKEKLKNFCFNIMEISDITRFEDSSFLNDSIYNYKRKTNSENTENLSSSIGTYRRDIRNIKDDIEKYQKQKDHFEIRHGQENNRTSGQYSEVEKENINKILRHLQMTTSNLTSFNNIIKDINEGDLSKYEHIEDKGFMEVAGRIIAYSMDNKLLWTDGIYIGLNSYDLLKQSFNCDDDIVIHRQDLSTGLSSANYLKQRIDNVQGDYVIILLDEIGNMSSDILGEILKSIKKLEEEDRLILALLTHPNTKNINIIPH